MPFCTQIIAALGYGHLFAWSVPGLLSGAGGPEQGTPGAPGIVGVLLVGALTVLAESRSALADFQEAHRLARLRYEKGLATYLDVLSAEEGVVRAQLQVAQLDPAPSPSTYSWSAPSAAGSRLPDHPTIRRLTMAERDPKELHEAQSFETIEIDEQQQAATKAKRKKLFTGFAAGVALIGGGYYAYDAWSASKHAATDNAYVGADVAQVTPLDRRAGARGARPGHAAGAPRRRAGAARRHRREDRGRPGRSQSRHRRCARSRAFTPRTAGSARRSRPARPTRPAPRPRSRPPRRTSKRPASTCSGAQALAVVGRGFGRRADHGAQRLQHCRGKPPRCPGRSRPGGCDPQRRRRRSQRQPRADRQLDGRQQSRSARGARRARPGPRRPRAHGHPRADRRRRLPAPGPGRPARPAGRAC